VSEDPRWIELRDPSAEELRGQLPPGMHAGALALLSAPLVPGDEPRPRLESHGSYLFGILLVSVAVPEDDTVYYLEIDVVATKERLVTVTKTPPGERSFDATIGKGACSDDDPVGMCLFRLLDEIAERYLDLIDALNDEIDELEENVETWRGEQIRRRVSSLRHDFLRVRRHLSPLRDAVHKIVDGRVELDDDALFPREVELHVADVYDKLLRATEGLETSRELLAGVREYFQAKIAIDQNEVTKKLAVTASLLLVPTFIVGVYGQNFRHIPELLWGFGYWWSWGLIVATTIAQLVFFRRKGWI
jgi:magnesium transporter